MFPLNVFPASVLSLSPVRLFVPGRETDLQLRVSAPLSGRDLPVILFSHGFGSSMNAYAPLTAFWAAHGFVVVQPTFLDSKSLSANPAASHSEAVHAFLEDPRKLTMWRSRVRDVQHVLDHLAFIEASVPTLQGRVNKEFVGAVGHSFGAQTTAMLLGARVLDVDGALNETLSDPRIRAGVLLSAGGRGGEALSSFAVEHFPHLNQSYDEMRTPTLVVAGDRDVSPLTTLGPEWFTDAFTFSPGAEWLLTLLGGEHMLGGISGYQVTETTDENPSRVAAVQRLTTAYLRSKLVGDDASWRGAVEEASLDRSCRLNKK
jgi:dienelactone hydrolase